MERIKHAGWIAEAAACMLLAVLLTACAGASRGASPPGISARSESVDSFTGDGGNSSAAAQEETSAQMSESRTGETPPQVSESGRVGTPAQAFESTTVEIAAQVPESERAEAGAQASGGGAPDESAQPVVLGDERADVYLPLLKGKRAALFSNQSGIVGNQILNRDNSFRNTENSFGNTDHSFRNTENSFGNTDHSFRNTENSFSNTDIFFENTENSFQNEEESSDPAIGEGLLPFGKNPDGSEAVYGEHILDALVRQGVDVAVVFSPEHGFRGTADAGAQVGDSIDEKTGIPVHSLYGGGSMPLSGEDLDQFDVLVVDIQDVGLRYYTYYITLYSLMDACASAGKEVVILDRPNPNGFYVDGPILQPEFASGVGLLPLPVVHGMTMGELAQMINGEGWLASGKGTCDLTVVSCENYTHRTRTALVTRPSPNLKDMRAVYLYASTCFFENTAFSVGRGTEYPFELYGSPYLQDSSLSEDAFSFIPVSMEGAVSPPFEGQECFGRDLREIPLARIMQEQIDLRYLLEAREALLETRPDISFFGTPDGAGHYWIDYLFGTDEVRRQIEDGSSAAEIEASWQEDVEEFCRQRRPYLLYAE